MTTSVVVNHASQAHKSQWLLEKMSDLAERASEKGASISSNTTSQCSLSKSRERFFFVSTTQRFVSLVWRVRGRWLMDYLMRRRILGAAQPPSWTARRQERWTDVTWRWRRRLHRCHYGSAAENQAWCEPWSPPAYLQQRRGGEETVKWDSGAHYWHLVLQLMIIFIHSLFLYYHLFIKQPQNQKKSSFIVINCKDRQQILTCKKLKLANV